LVSRSLTDGIKGKDFAARYGGEEFSIILPETGVDAGVIVANALRKAVESKEVVNRTTNKKLGQITMSIGVAQHRKGEIVEDLIGRADAALYRAKENGRNRVEKSN
ncbi:MAG: GGDEF domain-containing protein, partial [Gammaproteobacteria bacterium]|nr:GGDEF domain-containing protein [Gammaproteobacteria bacterium]